MYILRKICIIAGPTASGKSALAVEVAKQINAEIISADSMQIYEKMTIGTAKITEGEMDGIKHHLVDFVDPKERFTVSDFQRLALKKIEEITATGKNVIVVGGTGLYLHSLIYDMDFSNSDVDTTIRDALSKEAEAEGPEKMYEKLLKVDPISAANIHPNNVKRVLRALEVYYVTGKPFSVGYNFRKENNKFQVDYYALTMPRDILYQRINYRVDKMIEEGLIEEVHHLLAEGYDSSLPSMQGLGYKEIVAYLKGEQSLEEAIYILKRDTRHFAKRQLTWFKREENIEWLDMCQLGTEKAAQYIAEKFRGEEVE